MGMVSRVCPQCGGPIESKGSTGVCQYCGTSFEMDTANDNSGLDNGNDAGGITLSDEQAARIEQLLRAGDKILAIKEYRDITGAGLAEAKKFIEQFAAERGITHVSYSSAQPQKPQRTSTPRRTNTPQQKSGCYVATCVYGSYDCPQVWVLRRYRDVVLKNTWYGRMFIRCYYTLSPVLVRMFGKHDWFKNTWKPFLDRMVHRLTLKGFEDTEYED